MAPPPAYVEWWQQTKDCLGGVEDASFSRVRWFVRPEYYFKCGGEWAWACWYGPHDIVLAEHRLDKRSTVTHEMLHDLLRGGNHGHEAFTRCAY